MSTRRFFSDTPTNGNTIRVTGDEYHHLRHVNRAKIGDPVEVTDGGGSLFSGRVQALNAEEAIVDITGVRKEPQSPVSVCIAPSLLKQRPMNLMIEKLTEIGVDEIRPVIFNRTDDAYSPSRLKKWERIAIQSLKVNKRLWLTAIFPPVTIDEIIRWADDSHMKNRILLDLNGHPPGNNFAGRQFPAVSVIGPPGDMEAEERRKFLDNGFVPYKINDCVLKTETAAISIGAILKTDSEEK
jgi:16S rRNA (uracil1498-N3)-methyltransferase